jgi:DNA gyrase/topoisomerase IV subunit B
MPWTLALALRREETSGRQMPRKMHELAGVPVVSHALYLRAAGKFDEDKYPVDEH